MSTFSGVRSSSCPLVYSCRTLQSIRYFLWSPYTQYYAKAYLCIKNPHLANYLLSCFPAFLALKKHCLSTYKLSTLARRSASFEKYTSVYTVKPLHNCHLKHRAEWPLWGGKGVPDDICYFRRGEVQHFYFKSIPGESRIHELRDHTRRLLWVV